MIIFSFSKSQKGVTIKVHNQNGEPFNHKYNRKQDAKRALDAFVKQIREGKFKLK